MNCSATHDLDDDEEPFLPDDESLSRFIEQEVLPSLETRRKELSNRPLIREQAFGESLDPDKLERFARYEVHLDRKFERPWHAVPSKRAADRSRRKLIPFRKLRRQFRYEWTECRAGGKPALLDNPAHLS